MLLVMVDNNGSYSGNSVFPGAVAICAMAHRAIAQVWDGTCHTYLLVEIMQKPFSKSTDEVDLLRIFGKSFQSPGLQPNFSIMVYSHHLALSQILLLWYIPNTWPSAKLKGTCCHGQGDGKDSHNPLGVTHLEFRRGLLH